MAITFDGYPITSVDYEGTTLTHIADSTTNGVRMSYAAGTACASTPAYVNWNFVGFDYRYCSSCGGWQARARIRVCETNCCIGYLCWAGGAPNDFGSTGNPISVRVVTNLGFISDKYIYGCYPAGCNVSYCFKFPAGTCSTYSSYNCIPGNCGCQNIISSVGTATYCSEWTTICACDYNNLSCCSRTVGTWFQYSPHCLSVGALQLCGVCCYCTVNCGSTWHDCRTLCNNYVVC